METKSPQTCVQACIQNSFITETDNDITPIFTRYLYYKNDVVISMIVCILKKDIEQSLFWGYELYFSGFQQEVIDILLLVYKVFYKINESQSTPISSSEFIQTTTPLRRGGFIVLQNNKIKKFIENKVNEWRTDNRKDYILAILIHNILYRDSPVWNLNKKNMENKKKKIIYIMYNDLEIQKYKTLEPVFTQYRPSSLLKKVCVYSIILHYHSFFESVECDFIKQYLKPIDRKQLLEKYFYNWEYYSFFTPIWKERIQRMRGTADFINKKIIFQNEEMEEIFYDFYGYEPDEQPIEITENIIGVSF